VSSTLRFPTTFPCRSVSLRRKTACCLSLSLSLSVSLPSSPERQSKREIAGPTSSMMLHVDGYRSLHSTCYHIKYYRAEKPLA